MLKIRLLALGFALLAALTPAARAQGRPAPVSAEERHAVIAELAQLYDDHYVLPEVARTMGAALVAKEKAGAYDALTDPGAFADAVTRDLKDLGHDRHLRLSLKPPADPAHKAERVVRDGVLVLVGDLAARPECAAQVQGGFENGREGLLGLAARAFQHEIVPRNRERPEHLRQRLKLND